MAIETASYISDLNVANPPGSDPVGQADDHIRLLKSVLKSTFPNITGPVSATQAQLNYGQVPTGGVIMWSGSAASVPTGYALCDGGTYARSDGTGNIVAPDLRGSFIRSSGASTASPSASPTIGSTGGASSATPAITVSNEAVALTQAQLPSYNLTVTDPGHTHVATVNDPGHNHSYTAQSTVNNGYSPGGPIQAGTTSGTTGNKMTGVTVSNDSTTTGISVASGGSGLTHVHNNTATSSSISLLPPYYVLAFILKL